MYTYTSALQGRLLVADTILNGAGLWQIDSFVLTTQIRLRDLRVAHDGTFPHVSKPIASAHRFLTRLPIHLYKSKHWSTLYTKLAY